MTRAHLILSMYEASLSRIWQHTTGSRPYALLSAFRPEYTYKDNAVRNKEMATKIQKTGYGYFFVDGAWINKDGSHSKEDSLFVIADVGDKKFKEFIITLGKEYDQDAVLVRDQDNIMLISKDYIIPSSIMACRRMTFFNFKDAR